MDATSYDRIKALLDTRFAEICRKLRENGSTEERICLWQDFMQAGMNADKEFDAAHHGEWEIFILTRIEQAAELVILQVGPCSSP